MTIAVKSTIKTYFETGDKPTQAQFSDFIDSYCDSFVTTSDPTVNSDSSNGYVIGSQWTNSTSKNISICVDNTTGAAVWKSLITGSVTSTQIAFGDTAANTVTGSSNLTWTDATRALRAYGNLRLTCAAFSGSPNPDVWIESAAHTALTASTEYNTIRVDTASIQFSNSTIGTQRFFLISAPTYRFPSGGTITTSATLAISGAPIQGAGATLTNAYALWIQTGIVGLGTSSSAAGTLAFLNASNGNKLTIQSGATAASYTLTLPTAQGSASTVLQNDGSGNLSWAPAATIGGSISVNQIAYGSGTNAVTGSSALTWTPGSGSFAILTASQAIMSVASSSSASMPIFSVTNNVSASVNLTIGGNALTGVYYGGTNYNPIGSKPMVTSTGGPLWLNSASTSDASNIIIGFAAGTLTNTTGALMGAFNSGTLASGTFKIFYTTTSTTPLTGAMTVAGGLGVAGATTIGGLLILEGGTGAHITNASKGTTARFTPADTSAVGIGSTTYGNNNGFLIQSVGVDGSRAVPAATAAGQSFFYILGYGYDGSAITAAKAGYLIGTPTLWSGTNNETYHVWSGTPNGSTSYANWMWLQNGLLGVGGAPTLSQGLIQAVGSTSTYNAAIGSQNPQVTLYGGNTNNRFAIGVDNQNAVTVSFLQSWNAAGAGSAADLTFNPAGGRTAIGGACDAYTRLRITGTSYVTASVGFARTDGGYTGGNFQIGLSDVAQGLAFRYTTGSTDLLVLTSTKLALNSVGLRLGRRTITSAGSTTALSDVDCFVTVTGTAAHTVTLPAGSSGDIYIIKNKSSGNVTVDTSAAQTIDGSPTVVLTPMTSLTFVMDSATDWTLN